MDKIPLYLNKYFAGVSCILIYPMQTGVVDSSQADLRSPTIVEHFEKLEEIGKSIAKIFKKK